MRKHEITVPDPIQLKVAGGKVISFTLQQFFEGTVLKDPKWGASLETLEARRALRLKVERMNGKLLVDERTEWPILLDVVLHPTKPYEPELADQILEFMWAIKDAPIVADEN